MKRKEETVNIIYVSNDGYARHLAASLYSLLAHSRQIQDMDIYVLSSGMSPEYQKRIQAVAKRFGRQVYVEELGDLREKFPYDVDTRGFDISAMGRLFAPEVLPETVERALYLDCDTIVLGDNELAQSKAELKNIKTGEKKDISLGEDFIDQYITLSTQAADLAF